jgi:PAS domain S-box-containing protein
MTVPNMNYILGNLPVVVYEYTTFTNGTKGFTYLSEGSSEILCVDGEELIKGHFSFQDYIHRDDWKTFDDMFTKSFAALTPFKWEGRVFYSKEKIKWIEVHGIPVKYEDGRICWSGIISDIGPRKELELKQKESDTSYRILLESIPLGLGIHQGGRLVFANNYAVKLLEANDVSEIIGKSVLDFVHPEDVSPVMERVKKVLQGEPVIAAREKFVTLKGKVIQVETTAQPFIYNGVPSVQLIVSDITEQMKAQEIIRKTELLFSELFNSSPMAIVLLDNRGNVNRVNRGFEEMFGFTISELKGKSLNEFIVPQELEAEGNDLNSLISADQVVKFETTRIRRDNQILSVIIYGVPVHFEDETIGIFGVYVDITEQKKIEEELKIRNTELDNFVYKVSHDLRAPLSSVLGLVNLAQHPQNSDDPKEYLKIIGDRVHQLDNFINDVLSHSKNLKLEIKTSKVSFAEVIENTFQSLSYMEGADQMWRSIDIHAEEFYSDLWRVEEIFRNLISNAIKYKKKQGDTPEVQIKIKGDAREAHILFKDNGIGIHKQNLSRIFEMFYRASDQSGGSGIGLYIVKNAVEKLGGKIQVSSEPGVHTTFEIILPNQRNSAF